MKIKLTDLLRDSNFKHYRFLCSKDDFEEESELWLKEKVSKTESNLYRLHFVYLESLQVGNNYDLGYCLCWGVGTTNATNIARILQKYKQLDFDYLECDFEERTLYIHLKRKRD